MTAVKAVVPLLVIAALASGCAPVPPPTADDLRTLSDDAALAALDLGDARLGYRVVDLGTGRVVAALDDAAAFPPASTAKLATYVAALGILGPDYRFRTELRARGTLTNGVLAGDLILAGDGDPMLGAGDLRALAVRLADLGVTRVAGRFRVAGTAPALAEITPAQPRQAPYNQGVAGLNVAFNRAYAEGATADTVRVAPAEAAGLVGLPESPWSGSREVPVRDPALFAARLFARFARAEGIDLPAPQPGAAGDGGAVLARIESLTLIEIVRAGMTFSNNLVAEAVGLAATRARGARPETLAQSALTLGIWLEREITDLARFAPNLRNHSGLDAASRVTPRQMTAILKAAADARFGGWPLVSLLPPGGGRDGYRGRFRSPETAYRIWAKSGTMRYIKGLAGYLDALSGRRLAFALYVHDPRRRARLEASADRLGTAEREKSDAWRKKTDILEAALIRRWISAY